MLVLVMPRLSDSMEEGTIVRWLKADGDAVALGDELLEIETDKATETHESEHEGVLRIVAPAGRTLPVGAAIAEFGEAASPGEAPAAIPPPPDATLGNTPAGQPPAVAARPAASETSTAKGEVAVTELTRAQQLIARRMSESRATVPAFTLRTTVDMRACIELRDSVRSSGAEIVPTYNDVIIKACASALAEHPKANGAYRDGRFEHYSRVNVGIAVAARDTLVVPTIFDADRKGLTQIAVESQLLAERVRAGLITPPQLAGGTFTVSNLGMFGVLSFEAIINPPQAAVLSAGAIEPRPVVRDGAVVVREQMDVELACDHRILYGADAAQFLARIRALLEEPLRMAL